MPKRATRTARKSSASPSQSSKPTKPTKPSSAAADRLADKILTEVQQFVGDAQRRRHETAVLPKRELVKKLLGETSHSPFIIVLSWQALAARGSVVSPSVGIYNPDPFPYLASDLFAHAFWGPANVTADLDTYLLSADPAFPRFGVGVDVAPGFPISIGTLNIPLPTAVPAGTYLMNWLLLLRNPFGVGTVLERAGVYTVLT